MSSFPDHYAALGIDPTADQEVITAAYRALAKKYHPDTGATTGTASPERFEQIQQAYEVLRTPESRHRYDLDLLAATEAELEQHLAARQRAVPWAGEGQPSAPPPPPPDLGNIRPLKVTRTGPPPLRRPKKPRALMPFLVPLVLLLALAGGCAWLFLPKAPPAPPLPETPKAEVAVAKPEPAPPATPEAAPAAAPETPPVFGSTATDTPPVTEAAATPAAIPMPDAPPSPVAGKPLFGTSFDDGPAAASGAPDTPDAPAASPAPAPVPKPKPAHAARASVPTPPPAQAAAPAATTQRAAPRRLGPGGPYRLVIFERQPGQRPTAWSAGVVFKTQGSCTRFGVKAVLRRLANRTPDMEDSEVWYECQVASAN